MVVVVRNRSERERIAFLQGWLYAAEHFTAPTTRKGRKARNAYTVTLVKSIASELAKLTSPIGPTPDPMPRAYVVAPVLRGIRKLSERELRQRNARERQAWPAASRGGGTASALRHGDRLPDEAEQSALIVEADEDLIGEDVFERELAIPWRRR